MSPAPAAAKPKPARPDLAWVAAGALAIASGAADLWMTRNLRRLPSQLFGGDATYQMGCVRSILASGDPMASCSCSGALPGYLPLYGTLAATLARLLGGNVLQAMFLLSAISHAASVAIVAWVVGRHVSRPAGIVMAGLWAVVQQAPALRYTDLTTLVVVPLFFGALLDWLRAPAPRPAMVLGLTLGVLGYSHAVAFVGAIMITTLCGAALFVLRRRSAGVAAAARTSLTGLAIAGAGAALAIGYWWRPLFVFHGRTSPHYTQWNGPQSFTTLSDRFAYVGHMLTRLTHLEPWALTLLHALFFAAVVMLGPAATRRRFATVVIAAAATLAWVFHFFVTMPLLHTHFVPDYVRSMLWGFALVLLGGIPIALALERLSARARSTAVFAATIVACGVLAVGTAARADHPDMVEASLPYPPAYARLAEWAATHTQPNDVLLSTNEISFAWAALTGRKTLVSRRAQNDAFLDLDVRNADAAVIVYGRDAGLRRERLAHWNVRWLLWTSDWNDGEFYERPGMETITIDPLLWFSRADRDSAVARAGVAIERLHTWVDPAFGTGTTPRFDLTVVTAANRARPDRPWNSGLDPWLEEAWSFDQGGQRLATLYRVRGQ